MTKPLIAAQMYTVRDFCKTPAEIAESCQKVAAMGYTAIQSSGMGREQPVSAAELRRICDGEGLTICATHISFDQMRDETAKVIDDHNTMGCSIAGIGGAPEYARESETSWIAFAKEASEVAAKLAEADIDFVYHNHSNEFAKFGDRIVMDILFDESDPDYFKFELDTYWVQHGGGSPVAWIRKCSGREPIVHLKDFAITFDREQFYTEVGEGNLQWPGIMQACEDGGVLWMAVEQDTCPGNPFDSLRVSCNNLKSWGYE